VFVVFEVEYLFDVFDGVELVCVVDLCFDYGVGL